MYSQSSNSLYGFGNSESQLTQVGAASGIVMTADGYIITNRHCVINEDTGIAYDRWMSLPMMVQCMKTPPLSERMNIPTWR